jgi:hypothetical protein
MAQPTIRITGMGRPKTESDVWLMRAAQARRIATVLSRRDADIALSHAAECEAEAVRLGEARRPPIAA